MNIEIAPTRYNKRPMRLSISPAYTFQGKQIFSGTNDRGTNFILYVPYTIDGELRRYLWNAAKFNRSTNVGSRSAAKTAVEADVTVLTDV